MNGHGSGRFPRSEGGPRHLLAWTGHPLADVGIAGLCVINAKSDPANLTLEDLDHAAELMRERYFDDFYRSFLTCVFPNSQFVQSAGKAESKKAYVDRVLFAHRYAGDPEARGLACAFSGEPATHLLNRTQVPLLTGEGVLNFFPNAQGGLPVAGPYVTALHALPLAGARCEGRLLVAHADSPELTLRFAAHYWKANQRFHDLQRNASWSPEDQSLERGVAAYDKKRGRHKYPDAKAPRTLLLEDLTDVVESKKSGYLEASRRVSSVNAYWLSNSGQGPSLTIFSLPGLLVDFLGEVQIGEFAAPWKRVVARGWPQAKGKKSQEQTDVGLARPGLAQNQVLNDLLDVFDHGFVDRVRARVFLSRHLLGARLRAARAFDPLGETGSTHSERTRYSGSRLRERQGEWLLAQLFMEKVLGMERERINQIREFSHQLAEHVNREKNAKLLRGILYARRFVDLCDVLRRSASSFAKANPGKTLLGYELFVDTFLPEETVGYDDWRLTRTLVAIAMLEKLAELNYNVAEAVPADDETDDEETEK